MVLDYNNATMLDVTLDLADTAMKIHPIFVLAAGAGLLVALWLWILL